LCAGALAAGAAAVGFACGASSRPVERASTLPPAGSPADDGTGLLARWSVSSPEGGSELSVGPLAPTGGNGYGGTNYGLYGGLVYGGSGGNRYGGSRYARYQFDASFNPASATRPAVPPYDDYVQLAVGDGGAIEGTVTWPRPPRAPETLPVPAGSGCEDPIPNDSLRVGSDSAVAGAVVYLARIDRGRTAGPVGGVLERRGCRFTPHVQLVMPIGAPLRITNSDAADHEFVVAATDRRDDQVRRRIRAHGQTDKRSIDRAGIYRITSELEGDLASAYVVVPPHPYYAITDADGKFRLDSVPPGNYTLVTWHPPVVTGVDASGAPTASEPVEIRKKIKVTARKTSVISIALPAGR